MSDIMKIRWYRDISDDDYVFITYDSIYFLDQHDLYTYIIDEWKFYIDHTIYDLGNQLIIDFQKWRVSIMKYKDVIKKYKLKNKLKEFTQTHIC